MRRRRLLKQGLAFLLSLSMTLGPCAPGSFAAYAEENSGYSEAVAEDASVSEDLSDVSDPAAEDTSDTGVSGAGSTGADISDENASDESVSETGVSDAGAESQEEGISAEEAPGSEGEAAGTEAAPDSEKEAAGSDEVPGSEAEDDEVIPGESGVSDTGETSDTGENSETGEASEKAEPDAETSADTETSAGAETSVGDETSAGAETSVGDEISAGGETSANTEAETEAEAETAAEAETEAKAETEAEAGTDSAWSVLRAESEEAEISVIYKKGVFPEDAVLEAKKIDEDSEEQEEVRQKILSKEDSEEGSEDDSDGLITAVYELKVLDADGEEAEPDTEKGDLFVLFEGTGFSGEYRIYRLDDGISSVPKKLEPLASDAESLKELTQMSDALESDAQMSDELMPAEGKVLNDLKADDGQEENDGQEKDDGQEEKDDGSAEPDTVTAAVRTDSLGLFVFAWNVEQDLLTGSILLATGNAVDSGSCGENACWELIGEEGDLTLVISGSGEIRYSSDWNAHMSGIKAIEIGSGITGIAESTFQYFSAVEEIILPDTISKIADRTFEGCNNLKAIEIPEGVTGIGFAAFFECFALEEVKLPESLTSIGGSAFSSCEKLESIVIPDAVTSIGDRAFGYYDAMPSETRIVIHGRSGSAAQEYAEANDLPFVPTDTEEGGLFWGINAEGELRISGAALPDEYTGGVFDGSKVFTEYVNAPWYGERTGILSVVVDDAGGMVEPTSTAFWFYGLSNAETIDLSGLDTLNVTNMASMFRNCRTLENLDVRSFLTIETTDMTGMFAGCRSLQNLDLRNFSTDKVTSMNSMFMACQSLTELDLSSFNTSNVENMNQMFQDCSGMKALSLTSFSTNSLTNGDSMFINCSSLEELDLSSFYLYDYPRSYNWLTGCSALRIFHIPSNNREVIPLPHIMYDLAGKAYMEIPESSLTITLYKKAADDTTWQDQYTYYLDPSNHRISIISYKGSETNITLPAEATVYGIKFRTYLNSNNTWDNVKNSLESITFEPGVNENYQYLRGLFSGFTKLKSVDLPDLHTGNDMTGAFSNCTQLADVHMEFAPGEYEYYGESCSFSNLFQNCVRLKTVEISRGNSLVPVFDATGMFANCRALEKLDLGGITLSKDGSYQNMLQGCLNLSKITVPSIMEDGYGESYADLGVELPRTMYAADGTAFSTLPGAYGAAVFLLTADPVYSSGLTLDIHEATLVIPDNKCIQLTAEVLPPDTTFPDVRWSSSDNGIAQVDSSGLVTAVRSGTAVITASTADGKYSDTCTVTVTVPVTGIHLSETELTRPFEDLDHHNGSQVTLAAYVEPDSAGNRGVIWSSSDPGIIYMEDTGWDYPSGVNLYAIRPGTVTVTAATEDGGYTASCTVTVTGIPVTGVTLEETSLTIDPWSVYHFTAHVEPENASNQRLIWSSSDPEILSVDDDGNISTYGEGSAVITATSEDGSYTASCEVTAESPVIHVTGVTLDQNSLTLTEGDTFQLTAYVEPETADNRNVTWSSSDEGVAAVDENGNVTAVAPGSAVITATTEDDGYTADCIVFVPTPVTGVRLNQSEIFTTDPSGSFELHAEVEPSNATNKDLIWSNSNPSVASVNSTTSTAFGSIVNYGQAVITVTTVDGGYTASCIVTVSNPVTGVFMEQFEEHIMLGNTLQFSAVVEPLDAFNRSVTWSSTNENVVTVDENGLATARGIGKADIIVKTVDGGYTALCAVTVEPPVPTWKKLQTEINEAAEGSVILLEADYTAEADDTNLIVDKKLTIDLNGHTLNRGLSGQPGTSSGSVLLVGGHGDLTIQDSSVDGGGIITGGSASSGGGVRVFDGKLTMTGGSIRGNKATYSGGGVCIQNNAEFYMYGGNISSNEAVDGGGVFVSTDGTLELAGGEISGNSASSSGGGIDLAGGNSSRMTGGKVSGNSAGKRGGGIILGGTSTVFVVTGGMISGNTAGQDGGGISSPGTLQMENAVVENNTAANNAGGIDLRSGSNVSTMKSVSVRNNRAIAGTSGGIRLQGKSELQMENCVVENNSAATYGGGIHINGILAMTNGSVKGNTAGNNGGGMILNTGGAFNVQGNLVVEQNYSGSGSDRAKSNVYLAANKAENALNKITIVGALQNARIGVVGSYGPGNASSELIFTSGLKGKGSISCFSCDKDYDIVLTSTGEAAFKKGDPKEIFIKRLYRTCLGREADAGGLEYWKGRINSGSLKGIGLAGSFAFSGEFKSKNYCDEHFVKQLYVALMNREADDGGLAFWTGRLSSGMTREAMVNSFTSSSEYKRLCSEAGIELGAPLKDNSFGAKAGIGTKPYGPCAVCGDETKVVQFAERMYTVCLGRAADAGGLAHWSKGLYEQTITGKIIINFFFLCNEIKSKNLSNREYVRRIYKVMLDREPDQGGWNFWTGRLDSGASPTAVIAGFIDSREFTGICNDYGIKRK